MAEGWLTLSEVYNPLQAAMQIQQLENARKQNRLAAMTMREQEEEQQGWNKWQAQGMPAPAGVSSLFPSQETMAAPSPLGMAQSQNPSQLEASAMSQMPTMLPPGGGGEMPFTPVPEAPMAPPAPAGGPTTVTPTASPMEQPPVQQEPVPEEGKEEIMRGQKKLNMIMPMIKEAYKDVENKSETINKLHSMANKDKDIKTLFDVTGVKIAGGADPKKKTAWYTMGKNFTAPELKALADKYKGRGGDLLASLPEGDYTVEFNPIKDTITSFKTTGFEPGKEEEATATKTPSNMIQLMYQAQNDPDPEVRRKAKEALEGMRKYNEEAYEEKYGELTPEGVKLAAQEYLLTGRMTGGRSQRQVAAIRNEAAKIAAEEGMTIEEYMAQRATASGLNKSLERQLRMRHSMGSFVRNIEGQADRVNEIIEKIRRVDMRALNVPYVKWQMTIAGDPQERKLAMYFKELSTEIAKLTSGSADSIQQLPEGARTEWDKIHDPAIGIKAIPDIVNEVRRAANIRLESVDDEIEFTRERMRGLSKNKKGELPKHKGENTEKNSGKSKFTIIKVE